MIEELSKKVCNKDGVQIVTNYFDAVHWLHNSYVMANLLPELDNSVYDNMRFDALEDGEEDGIEIFQWFITSACESDVEYLEKRFNLKFTYSNQLDVFVLCVTHFGTSWDYVYNYDSEMDEKARNELKELDKKVQQ